VANKRSHTDTLNIVTPNRNSLKEPIRILKLVKNFIVTFITQKSVKLKKYIYKENFIKIPNFNGHIVAGAGKVARIRRPATITQPSAVPLQNFIVNYKRYKNIKFL
jgi:hypothetical protein